MRKLRLAPLALDGSSRIEDRSAATIPLCIGRASASLVQFFFSMPTRSSVFVSPTSASDMSFA